MIFSMLEKKLSLRNDFIVTGLNGISTVFGLFLVSGYMARSLGLDILGEYLFLRRIVTSFVGVLLLGMNITIPILIAKNRNSAIGDAAIIIFLFVTVPIIFGLKGLGNFYFFSGSLSLPHTLFILGFCFLTLTYSLYRGHLNLLGANLLQFIAGTIFSIISVYIATSLEQFLLIIGSSMFFLSFVAFFLRNRGIKFNRISNYEIKELINFGLSRIPGFIFQFFMLAGPPLLALSYLNLTDLAFLNAGLSLVRIFLIAVGPLGIILLPRVSNAISKGMTESLRKNLSLLAKLTLFYGSISSIALSQFSNDILSLWLGSSTILAGKTSQILFFSTPFFLLCAILRSPIDAITNRGYNSFVYAIGVCGMIATFLIMIINNAEPILAAAWGFFIGYFLAAIVSYIIVSIVFRLNIFSVQYLLSIFFSNITIYIIFSTIPFYGNLKMFISMVIFFILLTFHFLMSKEEWVLSFRRILFPN
tara:strand:+ start:3718 stop:5142 length:1425 start_codon:yes stop_codon:yes gene_type:complete